MATIGIWKITSNLKQVIDYTEDSKKTEIMTNEFNEAMSELINYVDNEFKNDNHLAITGINCSVDTALEEMKQTKKIWSKEDGILGYHAYQSFEKDSVTKEECHKIGVELAKEMWGDRFQVVVSSHYNTEHYHNHFVINSVSFKDGKKYYENRTTRAELRRLNDTICMEHGLNVLEEKMTRRHIYYPNYLNNDYRENYYTIAKKDIDNAIEQATSYHDFINLLTSMSYTVTNRYNKLSVRRNDYKKNIRIERFFGEDYSIDNIKTRIKNTNKEHLSYIEENYQKEYKIIPKNKKKYHGIIGLYRYYCYLLKVYPNNIRKYKLTPAMRLDVKKMELLSKEIVLLVEENIVTEEDLKETKITSLNKITKLKNEKSRLWYQYKKSTISVDKEEIEKSINEISTKIKPLREKLRLLNDIEKRKKDIEINLREYEKRKEVERNEPIK